MGLKSHPDPAMLCDLAQVSQLLCACFLRCAVERRCSAAQVATRVKGILSRRGGLRTLSWLVVWAGPCSPWTAVIGPVLSRPRLLGT